MKEEDEGMVKMRTAYARRVRRGIFSMHGEEDTEGRLVPEPLARTVGRCQLGDCLEHLPRPTVLFPGA